MAFTKLTNLTGALVISFLFLTSMLLPGAPMAHAQDGTPEVAGYPGAEVGVVEPGYYESPQFGHVIEWDAPWSADLQATETIRDIALDRLSIVDGESRFQAFHVAADGETAAEYADRFIAFRLAGDPTMTVTSSGERRGVSWAAYTFENGDVVTAGVVEISLVGTGSTIQVIEVMAERAAFDQAFEAAMESIFVDGDMPFRVLRGWPH